MIILCFLLVQCVLYAGAYDCSEQAFLENTYSMGATLIKMEAMYEHILQGALGEEYAPYQALASKVMNNAQIHEYAASYCHKKGLVGYENAFKLAGHVMRFGVLRMQRDHYGEDKILGIFEKESREQITFSTQSCFEKCADWFLNAAASDDGVLRIDWLDRIKGNTMRMAINERGFFAIEDWVTAWVHDYGLWSMPEDMGLLNDWAAHDGRYPGVVTVMHHDIIHAQFLDVWNKVLKSKGVIDSLREELKAAWGDCCKDESKYQAAGLAIFHILHEQVPFKSFLRRKNALTKIKPLLKSVLNDNSLLQKNVRFSPAACTPYDTLDDEGLVALIRDCYKKRGDDFLVEGAFEKDPIGSILATLEYWWFTLLFPYMSKSEQALAT